MKNPVITVLALLTFVFILTSCFSATPKKGCSSCGEHQPQAYHSFVELNILMSGDRENPLIMGSGSVVGQGQKDTLYILTAEHVCSALHGNHRFPSYVTELLSMEASFFNGHRSSATIVALDKPSDLCLLKTNAPRVPALKIGSSVPDQSEMYYTVSSPLGRGGKGRVLRFDGYYAGPIFMGKKLGMKNMYTIPTGPGASGSPVLNSKDEVVGVISMYDLQLFGVLYSPLQKQVERFVKETLAKELEKEKG